MTTFAKSFLLLMIVRIHACDPRKRYQNDFSLTDEKYMNNDDLEFMEHKRFGTDDTEPFWANRGKKDPKYLKELLYVKEPYWIVLRRNDYFDEEPFFVSRGKKETASYNLKMKIRNEYSQDMDSGRPFYAARGKKEYNDKMKS